MTTAKLHLDFIALGAQKAGTTTLHDWLAVHPGIAVPVFKETHFFADAQIFSGGAAWYKAQFAKDTPGKIIGEVDPEYLFSRNAPERIKTFSDAARFIILLRHPLERALSQYHMSRRRGYEPLSFREALECEPERLSNDPDGFAHDHHSYTARSLYCDQIERYRQTFPKAAFLIKRSDRLDQEVYQEICEYVQVKPMPETVDFDARSNPASEAKSSALRDALYAPRGKSAFRRVVVKMIPRSVKRRVFLALDGMNQQPLSEEKAAILASAPRTVLAAMHADLEQLEPLTGLDLSDWRKDLADRLEGAT
ncbi:MAG: sulfotransferase domain-containing protein [Pseudomonadota bacterium]